MGIFSRLGTLIKSNLNDLISKAEDPQKMLNQIVARHAEPAGRGQEAGGGLDRRREAPEEAVGRADRAVEGVGAQGDAGGPRRRRRPRQGGAARKSEHDNQPGEFGKQWHLQKQAVDKLKDQLRTLNDKIEEAKRKKNILIARQKRAEAQQAIQDTMRGLSDTSAFDTFERMAQKVDQIEAEAEASTELGGELTGDTLQQKFKELEGGAGADWPWPS